MGGVDGGTDEIVVRIVADGRYAPRCGEVREKAKYRDKRRERRYRHVPLWGISAFRRCRSPVPPCRSPIPEDSDHLGGERRSIGALGSGYGFEV